MGKSARWLLAVSLLGVALMAPSGPPAAADANSSLSPYWGPTITQWDELIGLYAGQRGLDPDLVASLIFEESHGLPNQVSVVGAVGLMQIMPRETGFNWRPGRLELLQPSVNLSWGTRTFGQVVQQAEGNLASALAAYNGGWDQIDYRGPKLFAGKVLDHYARAIAARAGFDARSMKAWTLVLDIQSSGGLARVDSIRADGASQTGASVQFDKLPATTPRATAYAAIDSSGVAWLVEAWVIVEPIEGGTPGGRGAY